MKSNVSKYYELIKIFLCMKIIQNFDIFENLHFTTEVRGGVTIKIMKNERIPHFTFQRKFDYEQIVNYTWPNDLNYTPKIAFLSYLPSLLCH